MPVRIPPVLSALLALVLSVGPPPAVAQAPAAPGEWPVVGGDLGGSRHSVLDQINRGNVADLEVAWSYRTGETSPRFETTASTALESTPLIVDGTMYVSTPLGRVMALDPATGAERWVFDATVPRDVPYGDFTNRGVAYWREEQAGPGATCDRRIFLGTIDARLVALDAGTGERCAGFGDGGSVDLRRGLRIPPFEPAAYELTSPPAVLGDLVIVGSAIADNSRPHPASGEVRAFDARSGELRWSWDPIPQDPDDPAHGSWEDGSAARTGGANVWSTMVADPERDLVFLPTSSPAPDYFGGLRRGSNRRASSIVALRASTGEVAWSFQTVHHDLWDYDNASPPALVDVRREGRVVPAVVQATKTGQLFVFHRETGEPLFRVEERAVPASAVPGEEAWPTQPFTAEIPPLSPHRYEVEDAWGPTEELEAECRSAIAPLRNEGIFTPPSREGTLVVPSNIGGAHWGGVAHDPDRGLVVVPVNRLAAQVQLLPADSVDLAELRRESAGRAFGWEVTRMHGTPYVLRRRLLMSSAGLPCTPPPFGTLVAVSLGTGERLWEVPTGSMPAGVGDREVPGSPSLGGPIVTAGGLVFMAGTLDRTLRAHDVETGEVLWQAQLPAGARATPATYRAGGRQFVVVTAGGGQQFGAGDHVIAFSLPDGSTD